MHHVDRVLSSRWKLEHPDPSTVQCGIAKKSLVMIFHPLDVL
jgi:hypothetical protein